MSTHQMTLRKRQERKQKLKPYGRSTGKRKTSEANDADDMESLTVATCRIRFDFGPSELNCRDFVFKAWLKMIPREFKNTIRPDDSFVVCYNRSASLEDICLDLFDSMPVEVPFIGEQNDDVIVCVIDDTVWDHHKALNKLYQNWNGKKVFTVMKTSSFVGEENLIPTLKHNHLKRVLYDGNILPLYEELYTKLESGVKRTKHAIIINGKFETERKKECERRLEELLTMLSDRKREQQSKLSPKCVKLLKSAIKDGIIGYRLSNNVLTLYVNEKMKDKKQVRRKLEEIKSNFASSVRTCFVKIPFLCPHHAISAGDRIRNKEHNFCGTLGMFGNLSQKGNCDAITIAITSPHVLWNEMTATVDFENNVIDLGKCVWPNQSTGISAAVIDANLSEISVLIIEKKDSLTMKNFSDPVTVYTDQGSHLNLRRVFKYGATTNKTTGSIFDAQFSLYGNEFMVIIPEEEENFSQPGDSGAIVLTRQGRKLIALGVICGGDIEIRQADKMFPNNAIIAVNLHDAIQRFNHNSGLGMITVGDN